ncbi:hypothetical protein LSAT2_003894 [Lamellibrachia satsuma]|nr:hypothetical protein LSAT2_003894 [Lamellibrachia satsuma]
MEEEEDEEEEEEEKMNHLKRRKRIRLRDYIHRKGGKWIVLRRMERDRKTRQKTERAKWLLSEALQKKMTLRQGCTSKKQKKRKLA